MLNQLLEFWPEFKDQAVACVVVDSILGLVVFGVGAIISATVLRWAYKGYRSEAGALASMDYLIGTIFSTLVLFIFSGALAICISNLIQAVIAPDACALEALGATFKKSL